ncbi:MAG: OpgC domain-containing protein [Bdellovibrionota bacterium]
MLLSFVGYFLLAASSGTFLEQLTTSVTGIAMLCCVAYCGEWSKKADKLIKRPLPVVQTTTGPSQAA